MSEYYVNYGRWMNGVVGPFEDKDVAQEYADMAARDATVVTVAKPDSVKLAIAVERCKRTFYVTMCRTKNTNKQLKLVIVASSDVEARTKAWEQLESDFGISRDWLHLETREV